MISGTIQLDDMLSAQKKHLLSRKSFWFSVAIVLVSLGASAWLAAQSPEDFGPLGFLWVVFAILIPLQFYLFRRNIRRSYFQRKDLQRPASYEPGDEGLTSETENAKAFKPWSDYLKWSESAGVFLLYMSDNLFQIVPKHFFSSPLEVDAFRATLRRHIRGTEA